jgi:hypothetical protein
MLKTTDQVCAISRVSALQPCPDGVRVVLDNHLSATLTAGHADYELLLQQVEGSLRLRYPVGVMIDPAGRLVDLSPAHPVTVRSVQEDDAGGKRLAVAVWELGALSYLACDHPDFEHVRSLLVAAASSGERVLLANRTWPRETEGEVWNAILYASTTDGSSGNGLPPTPGGDTSD